MKFPYRLILIVALLLPVVVSGPASTALAAPEQQVGDDIAIDFRNVELSDLVQTISELTGKNFIYDDNLKGRVSIISPDRMSVDEAYEAFLSVLSVKGYTIVPSGRTNKIVPIRLAKESSIPVVAGSSDQYVTRLIRLQYVDANLLATTVLAPLVPKTSHVAAYTPSNTLIISDSASNIERLLQIIRQLDVPTSLETIEVIGLQYAGAEELATMISALIGRGDIAAGKKTKPAGAGNEASRIIPYPRTNSLVVIAAAGELLTIRNIISRLDQPPPDERSHINVYYLEHADAEEMAATLNELITGITKTKGGPNVDKRTTLTRLQGVTVSADKPTNSLIVNAQPEDYEILKNIIKKLDIKRTQVFVEALILELSLDATKDLGVSMQGAVSTGDGVVIGTSNLNTGSTNNTDFLPGVGTSIPSLLGKTINGMMLGGFFNPITVTGPDGSLITVPAFSALIELSQTDSDVNVLAAPRLLASDNEEAEIIVGSNVPIITQRLTDTTNPNSLSVNVERQDVALILRFTPQVTEGDQVRLEIFQEITDVVSEQQSVGNVNEVGPTLTKRSLRNTALADNGRTVVLGGLISTAIQDSVTKVPFLGDIPLLGWLFKSTSLIEKKNNLLIFITPHIIRTPEDLERVTSMSREAMERNRQQPVSFDKPVEEIEEQVKFTEPTFVEPAGN